MSPCGSVRGGVGESKEIKDHVHADAERDPHGKKGYVRRKNRAKKKRRQENPSNGG